jgi:hypothetical protein
LTVPPRIESVEGVAFDTEVTDAGLVVRTHAQGPLRWRLPEGWSFWGFGGGTMPAALAESPALSGRDREPTALALRSLPLRTLNLTYGDGRPATDAQVIGAQHGTLDFGALDPQGVLTSANLVPDVQMRARADGHVDLQSMLQGDGPYVLRWGPVDLALSVRAGSRPAEKVVACVRGRLYAGQDGVLRLRGFEPGWHELLVGTPGCKTVIVRSRAPASGTWALDVVLAPLE